MVQDTRRRRLKPHSFSIANDNWRKTYENDFTEPTGRKEQVDPGLDLGHLDVETWRDDARLVESTIQLNDDLSGTMVVDYLKFANVACKEGVVGSVVRIISWPEKRAWRVDLGKKGHLPWRCITLRNFTTTLDEGRISTWRFPRRSALTMLFCNII